MTTDDTIPRQCYSATIGVYVRTYCNIVFEAENDEAAPAAAIAVFKERELDLCFDDTDWTNLALPCIVTIDDEDDRNRTVAEAIDFPLSAEDARDLASADILESLETVYQYAEAVLGPQAEEMIKAGAAIAKAKGHAIDNIKAEG